jgi:hypothetical protein
VDEGEVLKIMPKLFGLPALISNVVADYPDKPCYLQFFRPKIVESQSLGLIVSRLAHANASALGTIGATVPLTARADSH